VEVPEVVVSAAAPAVEAEVAAEVVEVVGEGKRLFRQ
jgi:hypothetical protein